MLALLSVMTSDSFQDELHELSVGHLAAGLSTDVLKVVRLEVSLPDAQTTRLLGQKNSQAIELGIQGQSIHLMLMEDEFEIGLEGKLQLCLDL